MGTPARGGNMPERAGKVMVDEDIRSRLDRIEPVVLATQQRVTLLEKADAVADVHRTNVEARLVSIEDTLKWLVRLVLGALVLAVIAFLVDGGFHIPSP